MPKRFSTARGREFGDGVRAAIARTGLTGREICEKIGWDPSKLSDLFHGKGGCSEVDLAILLSFCHIAPDERDHMLQVFRQMDTKDWWQHHGATHPVLARTWYEHLRKAKEFISWCPLLIPGLLQLPDYMRAVFAATVGVPDDEIEQRVAARLGVQEVFRQRLKCTFFIHEQILFVPVGGADVLRAQLHHLLQMSVRPYIEIRIVPIAAGAHAGFAGSFELMKFHRIEPVVFIECENSDLIIEGKTAVNGYANVLTSLDRTALDAEQSRRRILELAT
ncbi:helix-turn-helix transcriptional regulator [Lentzea sp. NPDC004782]|uniref:helix-turn-helix domain-containing protein n=1 Tax=Lentzea sp. NPDC004782 TaxID=3154458 RepID=UPI0033AF54BD